MFPTSDLYLYDSRFLYCPFPDPLSLFTPLPTPTHTHAHCHQQPQATYEWYSFYNVTSWILLMNNLCLFRGFPGGASGKEPACRCRRCKRRRFSTWVQKICWRTASQSTPVFLPGESLGQRSLAGYSPYPMDRGAWQTTVHRVARVGHDWSQLSMHTHICLFHFHVTSEFLMWGL